jgi:hypothetical protein
MDGPGDSIRPLKDDLGRRRASMWFKLGRVITLKIRTLGKDVAVMRPLEARRRKAAAGWTA